MPNNCNSHQKMVLIDLDGTLLNKEKKIGDKDFQTLEYLGKSGTIRVIATGRNLYSANKVLDNSSPFDFLVFSSGAGIMNWKTKELLFQSHIQKENVVKIEHILKETKHSFSIQCPIPENHKFYFHRGSIDSQDFEHRLRIYHEFCTELTDNYPFDQSSQFLIILNDESEINPLLEKIEGFKVIRATSPLDEKSIWIEIFNKNVSKGHGGRFLCSSLNISHNNTIGIGNDYNDLDLLDWAAYSFLVANAPEAIKHRYKVCADNQNNPLTDVISTLFN